MVLPGYRIPVYVALLITLQPLCVLTMQHDGQKRLHIFIDAIM